MTSRPRTRQHYTDEQRAAVLADVVLIGAGAASAKYDIPRSTITTWQDQYDIVHNPALKKANIEFLAANYLEASLQALSAQAYVASQPEYIERQPAGELAILHGVMADKSVRLLEALSRRAAPPALDGD